jgi:phosphatidylserine/phosphatidylglycerophosphate/cardiolipin synthase-like enzyme
VLYPHASAVDFPRRAASRIDPYAKRLGAANLTRWAYVLLLLLLSGCVPELVAEDPHREFKPPAAEEDGISAYFSPHGGAMAAVLEEINEAQKSIDVQAYLLTSKEIADALEAAHQRGVRVRIILDKNHLGGVYSYEAFFSHSAIPVWRDGRHKDAHDKIMLIDGNVIITGSFNFTKQSEDDNSENLLIIRNKPILFQAYLAHFEEHLRHSDPAK